MMPLQWTVFFTAILKVRLYNRFKACQIARYGFTLVAAAALWLAFVVRNDWSTFPVLLGLAAFGIGQEALMMMLFNVLVTASPIETAGVMRSLTANPILAAQLKQEVKLDNINFLSNDRLAERLKTTTILPNRSPKQCALMRRHASVPLRLSSSRWVRRRYCSSSVPAGRRITGPAKCRQGSQQ